MSKKKTGSKHSTKSSPMFLEGYRHLFTTERIIIGGTLLAILAIMGGIAFNSWQSRIVDIEGVERTFVQGGHQETVSYPNDELPPAGGIHHPTWQNCGIYDTPLAPEFVLHSLEHGAIWIAYHPDLPLEQIEQLQEITRDGSHRLLAPYSGLESPIVLSAWGYQLQLTSADDSRLADFIRNYEKRGQSPEPGALCSNGIGQPIQ